MTIKYYIRWSDDPGESVGLLFLQDMINTFSVLTNMSCISQSVHDSVRVVSAKQNSGTAMAYYIQSI